MHLMLIEFYKIRFTVTYNIHTNFEVNRMNHLNAISSQNCTPHTHVYIHIHHCKYTNEFRTWISTSKSKIWILLMNTILSLHDVSWGKKKKKPFMIWPSLIFLLYNATTMLMIKKIKLAWQLTPLLHFMYSVQIIKFN